MKPKPASSKQPPTRRPLDAPVAAEFLPNSDQRAAGGPSTRGDSRLGKVLADFLAYFEVRNVSTRDIELIRPTHANGWLRPQIQAKLDRLHPNCPDHLELQRLVTLSLELLSAVDAGRFNPGPTWAEVEPRLLRALAYFVQEGDAIPDHLPHGFDDDMREFKGLAERANDLFGVFEAVQNYKGGPRPVV